MKASDLRNKSIDELKQELLALTREIFNLRIQKGMGQLPKSVSLKQVRTNIARIKTVLKEKGLNV